MGNNTKKATGSGKTTTAATTGLTGVASGASAPVGDAGATGGGDQAATDVSGALAAGGGNVDDAGVSQAATGAAVQGSGGGEDSAAPPAAASDAPAAAGQTAVAAQTLQGDVRQDEDEASASTRRLDFLADVVYGFEVSSMRDGFRRAGRAWMREPVFLTEDDISLEQFELLRSEPNIRIVPATRSSAELDDAK